MRQKPKQLSDDELLVILNSEERTSVGYFTQEIAADQEKAFEYYRGDYFGDEVEGSSQVVSRDVAEVVDWMLPSCMRVFLSSDKAVIFRARKPEDERAAELATSYCNYVFRYDNDGFTWLHEIFKSAFIQKVGVGKIYWEDLEKRQKEDYEGVTLEQAFMLEEDLEITRASDREDGLYDLQAVRSDKDGRVRMETVPPEEFLISRRAKSLDSAVYTAQRSRRTLSDLIEMGFPENVVFNLPTSTDELIDEREVVRFEDEDYTPYENREQSDPAMSEVWVLEEYIKVDFDGDGIGELRQIIRIGDKILYNEEVDEHPWVTYTPIPMPHKFYGQSLADKTMDIQHIKSTLTRQLLNNIYLAMNPQKEVPEMAIGENTMADLLTARVGGIIRTASPGLLREVVTPDMSAAALKGLDHMDKVRQQRTGITETNQGLATDTLNPTMGGAAMIMDAANEQKDFYVRNMGETCFRDAFRKILRLLVRHQDWNRAIQVDGSWVQVNPQDFDPDMSVEVKVGLGTGNRQEKMQNIVTLIGLQQQAAPIGMATPKELFNAADELTDAMGLKATENYFVPPDQIQPPQQPPDPKLVEIEAKKEIEAAKIQADLAIEQAKIESEEKLKMMQLNAEIALREKEMGLDAEVSLTKAGIDSATKIKTSQTRLGGDKV